MLTYTLQDEYISLTKYQKLLETSDLIKNLEAAKDLISNFVKFKKRNDLAESLKVEAFEHLKGAYFPQEKPVLPQ